MNDKSNLINTGTVISSQRKDPKKMTIDELEEYINSHRNSKSSNNNNNEITKSQKTPKENEVKPKTKDMSAVLPEKENQPGLGDKLTSIYGLNYNYLSSANNPISEGDYEEKSNTARVNNNCNNSQNNITSQSEINCLKLLHEKIRLLENENDELKMNFIQISELLEKERIIKEDNLKTLRNNISSLSIQNQELLQQLDELKRQLSFRNTNISILENEKGRHLEQNAIEKNSYETEIENLKSKLASSYNEVKNLNSKISIINEDIGSFELTIQALKEENHTLKQTEKQNSKDFHSRLEEMTREFESEKSKFTTAMKSMKDENALLKKEKAELTRKYERNFRELTVKINRFVRSSKDTRQFSPPTKGMSRNRSKDNLSMMTTKKSNVSVEKIKKSSDILNSPATSKSNKSQMKISNGDVSPNIQRGNLKKNNSTKLLHVQEQIRNPSLSPARNTTDISQINESIFTLERTIAELNRNYKNLLSKLNEQLTKEEEANIRKNLNTLATSLQEQSQKLIKLKSFQQEILKNSLTA